VTAGTIVAQTKTAKRFVASQPHQRDLDGARRPLRRTRQGKCSGGADRLLVDHPWVGGGVNSERSSCRRMQLSLWPGRTRASRWRAIVRGFSTELAQPRG
jgi:hypothetical protein